MPRLSEFLAQQMGLHFPADRWPDLARGMEAAALEFRFPDAASCIQWLLSAPLSRSQVEILSGHLTVGETYFFREPQVFDVLQTHILPALIQSRRQSGQHLRLWSAGCASGEEAYSLAILLQRLLPDFRQWNISILATDINPHALQKAAAGIYGDWSFRNAPPWLREGYFRAIPGGQYEIVPAVREMVTFSYLNLAADVYPSLLNNTNAMDVIFCRNVLMYFEPGLAADVVRRHYLALVGGGWLVVSPAEMSQALFAPFATINFPGVILHRKSAARAKPPAEPSAVPAPLAGNPWWPSPAVAAKADPGILAAAPAARRATLPKQEQAPATYPQAFALYRQGRYAEATSETTKLLALQPDDADAMILMARIHANQGELAAALQWCEQTIAADRLNPVGHFLLAAILQEQGRMEEAMLLYKRTLYLDQDFVLAHFALGNLHLAQGNRRETRRHLNNALELLRKLPQDEILPEADGLSAGRLAEIITSVMASLPQPVHEITA